MKSRLYPLTFTPVLKDYIWGGRNLETKLGRELPEGKTAESWEIAGHEDGATVVDNGPLAGTSLPGLMARFGLDLIGSRSAWAYERGKFPLLIKLLDATRSLSVQVHPDDDYALENEGNELGKTEMWVVLHAGDDAKVILGVKKGTTPALFQQAIAEGDLERHLHEIPIRTGDYVCVPAGSVHAIMAGALLAEIQQNSNTTYRVYDWNRLGADGKPRQLHVKRALDVINFQQVEPALPHPQLVRKDAGLRRYRLCGNRYFTVERVEMQSGVDFHGNCDGTSFEIWGVIKGDVSVTAADDGLWLSAVRFTLLPASLGEFTISTQTDAILLRAYVASLG